MTRFPLRAALSATLAALPLLAGLCAAARAQDCPRSALQTFSLPRSSAAIESNKQVVVAALGSSSTQGWMATDIAHSYPALLQELLTQGLPRSDVSVINRGVGGQDAPEELARLDADVLALRPQLVIWQVGANGALHRADPAVFRGMVQDGVRQLLQAGADVILMDNQRSPQILASPDGDALDQVLAGIAREQGVGLFSRRRMMDDWAHEGSPYADFVATDGLHLNNRGYACLARALAQGIEASLVRARTVAGRAPP